VSPAKGKIAAGAQYQGVGFFLERGKTIAVFSWASFFSLQGINDCKSPTLSARAP